MIYFISDLHLYHDRAFIYSPRGFDNVEDMSNTIMSNILSTVKPNDDLYILGDIYLNDDKRGLAALRSIPCKVHIIRGNHDTNKRAKQFATCENVVEIVWATMIEYKKYNFFLTHFPSNSGNLEKARLKECICNLYGHTHQKSNFYKDMPYRYHVGCDSHNCMPVSIDDAIADMENEVKKCKQML